MITIRSNCYNANEKDAIHQIFEETVKSFINKYCVPSVTCDVCPYRHLCYDLTKARNFTFELKKGGDAND